MNLQSHLQDIEKRFDEEFSLPPEIGSPTAGSGYVSERRWTISRHKELKSFLTLTNKETVEKVVGECIAKVDWILTPPPHAYESGNPAIEAFAIKLKENYKEKINQALSSLKDQLNEKR